MIYSFTETAKSSFQKTNRQLFVLLKVLLALVIYIIRDFLILSVIFLLGAWLDAHFGLHKLGLSFEILSLLLFFLLLVKINGTLGLALTYISIGENQAWEIAGKSQHQGISFFVNALRTGVVLFFGQILIVCPCFLMLSNFLFSPFLFVYEDLKGTEAKQRSIELVSGSGWIILNRTVAIIFVGYILAVLALLLMFSKFIILALSIWILCALYLALLQSNFIREIYLQTLELTSQQKPTSTGKYKLLTIISIFFLLVVYVLIKVLPHLIKK